MKEEFPAAVEAARKAGKQILELSADDERKYYFEKPGRKDMERFLTTSSKGKVYQAVNNLIIEKAIHPTGAELQVEFETMPGRMVSLNNGVQTAIGLNEDYAVKKL